MATSVYEDLSAEVPQRREPIFFPAGESDTPFAGREKVLTGKNTPEEEKLHGYPDNGFPPTPYNARAGSEDVRFTGEQKGEERFPTGTTDGQRDFPLPGRKGSAFAGNAERETDFSGLRAMARLYGDLAGFSKREEGAGRRSGGDPLSERFRGRINRSTDPEALSERTRSIRRNGWSPYPATGQRPNLYEGTEGGKPSLYE